MTVYVRDLETHTRRIVGDTSTSPKWSKQDYLDTFTDAVDLFNNNGKITQQYEILGTGNGKYINPDPTAVHKSIMCYYTAVLFMENELAQAARSAISYSNPAGNTNLTNAPKAIEDAIERLEKRIDTLSDLLYRNKIEDDMEIEELTTQE